MRINQGCLSLPFQAVVGWVAVLEVHQKLEAHLLLTTISQVSDHCSWQQVRTAYKPAYDNVTVNVFQYFNLLFCGLRVLPNPQSLLLGLPGGRQLEEILQEGLHLAYVSNSTSFSLTCLKKAWWHQQQGPCPPHTVACSFCAKWASIL